MCMYISSWAALRYRASDSSRGPISPGNGGHPPQIHHEDPKGRWILGGSWDHEKWPGAPLPTREMIDAATPEHPVFVHRLDGHMVLAESLALKRAGITKKPKTRRAASSCVTLPAVNRPASSRMPPKT